MALLGDKAQFTLTGFTADIISIESGGQTWESVPTTHLQTGPGKTFLPGDTYDPETVTLTIQYDPDQQPPQDRSVGVGTITYRTPDGGAAGATEACDVFVMNFAPGTNAVDAIVEGTVTFKRTGDLTYTPSS